MKHYIKTIGTVMAILFIYSLVPISLANEEPTKKNQIAERTEAPQKLKTPSRSAGNIRRVQTPSHRNFKAYMDYKTITSKNSLQYKLQEEATTDEQGFRRLNGEYMIALGSYWGKVGDRLKIEIDGEMYECIIGDQKADIHTDEMNRLHFDNSLIEFIVDNKKLEKTIKKMGDCSYESTQEFKEPVDAIIYISN